MGLGPHDRNSCTTLISYASKAGKQNKRYPPCSVSSGGCRFRYAHVGPVNHMSHTHWELVQVPPREQSSCKERDKRGSYSNTTTQPGPTFRPAPFSQKAPRSKVRTSVVHAPPPCGNPGSWACTTAASKASANRSAGWIHISSPRYGTPHGYPGTQAPVLPRSTTRPFDVHPPNCNAREYSMDFTKTCAFYSHTATQGPVTHYPPTTHPLPTNHPRYRLLGARMRLARAAASPATTAPM